MGIMFASVLAALWFYVDMLDEVATISFDSSRDPPLIQKTLWEADKFGAVKSGIAVTIMPLIGLAAALLNIFRPRIETRFLPIGIGVFMVCLSSVFILSASMALLASSLLMLLAGLLNFAAEFPAYADDSPDAVGH